MEVTRTAEMARAWVERTCAAQGLSVHVTDAATVQGLAVLLRQTRQIGARRSGSKRLRPRTAGDTTTRSRIEATIAR